MTTTTTTKQRGPISGTGCNDARQALEAIRPLILDLDWFATNYDSCYGFGETLGIFIDAMETMKTNLEAHLIKAETEPFQTPSVKGSEIIHAVESIRRKASTVTSNLTFEEQKRFSGLELDGEEFPIEELHAMIATLTRIACNVATKSIENL